jgi:hypothetical protein
MDDLDLELDDVVLFELPAREHVEAFRDRIRPRWEGWSDAEEHLWLFSAQFERGDLAPLLRDAQALVAEIGLTAITYCLDGRLYVLEAPRPCTAGDLAARSK